MGNVTLKQLAELTNLSIRTVGRVLNGSASVTPEKRERVLRVAREFNYVPNMAARNLRLQNRSIVGILCGESGNAVFIQRLRDLEDKLARHGFYPLLGSVGTDWRVLNKIFADWSGLVDYTAVMRTGIPEECFNDAAMEFIFVDEYKGPRHHALEADRAEGVCEAFLALQKAGRKRILRCGNIISRTDGIRRAFEQLASAQRPELIAIDARPEFESGLALGPRIVATHADAVFFDTDRMAAGFLAYAARNDVRVPEKIAVIGFDDDPVDRMIEPELSTVAHPIEEMNSALVDIVLRRPREKVHRVFGSHFIERRSSRTD